MAKTGKRYKPATIKRKGEVQRKYRDIPQRKFDTAIYGRQNIGISRQSFVKNNH